MVDKSSLAGIVQKRGVIGPKPRLYNFWDLLGSAYLWKLQIKIMGVFLARRGPPFYVKITRSQKFMKPKLMPRARIKSL